MYRKRFFQSIALMLVLNLLWMGSAFAGASNLNSKSENANLGEAETYVINKGIMKGDGNGNYSMSKNIKRGDLAVMIVRAFELGSNGDDNFSDVPSGSYYYEAIAALKNMKIAMGDGKSFKPEKNVTLEEAILFIERAAGVADSEVTLNSVNLRKIFNGQPLSELATRGDVANLLYYAFTTGGNTIGEEDSKVIYYTVKENKKVKFKEDDFTTAYENATGGTLESVNFKSPADKYGKLYYDYSSASKYDSIVDKSAEYYSVSLSHITFVPQTDYSGVVSIPYTAYNRDGDPCNGEIKITVEDDDMLAEISYTTNRGRKINFDKQTFSKVFKKVSDSNLDYIQLTLPSVTYGKLYYLYTSATDYDSLVKASTKYYVDESPYLSDISFVPRSDYLGEVSIAYTAYNEKGDSYVGTVKVTVEEDEHAGDTVSAIPYTTYKNKKVDFNDKDFSKAFDDTIDDKLYSVKFTLPSASCGKLYYGYASASQYDSLVNASAKYYVGSTPSLNDITFVPKSGYTGTVSISYTAYNGDGETYPGIVEVTVLNNNATIAYTTSKDKAITFNAANFSNVFHKATGGDLSYVIFALPSSSCGRMYYKKISANSYQSVVKDSTKYTVDESSAYLSEVTFVPGLGYTGTISISYRAFNEDGGYNIGIVKITVK